jgi:outer membrane protein
MGTHALSLEAYLQRVVDYNESIQARLIGFHASRDQLRAERGVFEPAAFVSFEAIDRQRPNTIELERALRSGGFFVERNQIYSSGLEGRIPTGGRVRVGATLRDLSNNVQRTVLIPLNSEYEGSVGVTIEQPLLKGVGAAVNLAGIRLAARASESAFQEYRRELMLVVAQAEVAYWELRLAQEQLRLADESVVLARSIFSDNQANRDAGRGSELEVLEAQSGLALRISRQSVARQRLVQASNRFASLFGASAPDGGMLYVAAESPEARLIEASYEQGIHAAFTLNPDLQRARSEIAQEEVRFQFARVQRLPTLDLRAGFGLNALGESPERAWRDFDKLRYPQWSAGLEFRVPILGGIRERSELSVARHRLRRAELGAREVEVQVRAGLDTAIRRMEAAYVTSQSFGEVVSFRQSLLQAQLQRRDAGRVESRAVLEAEEDLFEARIERLDSEVEFQRSLLELQLIQGDLLQNRGLELTFEDLETKTAAWARHPSPELGALRYRPVESAVLPSAPPAPLYEPVPEREPVDPLTRRRGRRS